MIQELINQIGSNEWGKEEFKKTFYSGKKNFLTIPEKKQQENTLFIHTPVASQSLKKEDKQELQAQPTNNNITAEPKTPVFFNYTKTKQEQDNILWLQAKEELNIMEV